GKTGKHPSSIWVNPCLSVAYSLRCRLRRCRHARLVGIIRRGVQVNGLPLRADFLEDQYHAAGVRLGLSVEGHRLRPKTRHYRAARSQHGDVSIFDVELHVSALREGTLTIFL